MTLQLQKVSVTLQSLKEKLQKEHEIKDNLVRLVEEGCTVCDYFCTLLTSQRDKFLKLVEMLKNLNAPDVNVSELKDLLKGFSEALHEAENKVMTIKTHTHLAIEDLRCRMGSFDKDIKSMEVDILRMSHEVQTYKNKMEELKGIVEEIDRREKQLRESASHSRSETQKTSAFALGVGAVFAPFTGGLSLVVGAAGTGFKAGYQIAKEVDCAVKAHELGKEAEDKRQQARQNEELILENQSKQHSLLSDQLDLRNRKDQMTDATKMLEQVIRHICGAITIMQDLENELHKIDLQIDTFKVVQLSLVNNPVKIQGIAQKQLDKLRVKLRGLRDFLVQLLPQDAFP